MSATHLRAFGGESEQGQFCSRGSLAGSAVLSNDSGRFRSQRAEPSSPGCVGSLLVFIRRRRLLWGAATPGPSPQRPSKPGDGGRPWEPGAGGARWPEAAAPPGDGQATRRLPAATSQPLGVSPRALLSLGSQAVVGLGGSPGGLVLGPEPAVLTGPLFIYILFYFLKILCIYS